MTAQFNEDEDKTNLFLNSCFFKTLTFAPAPNLTASACSMFSASMFSGPS